MDGCMGTVSAMLICEAEGAGLASPKERLRNSEMLLGVPGKGWGSLARLEGVPGVVWTYVTTNPTCQSRRALMRRCRVKINWLGWKL